jgi:light-regulated signal transduction histidine kinase (bacteriophytochrome)
MSAADVDMNLLVEEALKELASRNPGRQPNVDVALLPRVRGETAALRRVWIGLLENAIKSTAANPDARIEIGATWRADETTYFVKDNGVGFDRAFIDNHGEDLLQLAGDDELATTVALAAAQRIIGSHGGRLWQEEVPNAAPAVFFSLPSKDRRR